MCGKERRKTKSCQNRGQFQSAKNKDAESKKKIEGQREIQEMVSVLQQAIRTETVRITNN